MIVFQNRAHLILGQTVGSGVMLERASQEAAKSTRGSNPEGSHFVQMRRRHSTWTTALMQRVRFGSSPGNAMDHSAILCSPHRARAVLAKGHNPRPGQG